MTCSFLLIQFGIISSGFEPSGRHIGLLASPPPLLSHQGHASCCAARSFFFFFFSPVFSMHGESHIWSAEGERCRPFRAHVVIATHLVGAPPRIAQSTLPSILDAVVLTRLSRAIWTWSCALIVIGVRSGLLSAVQGFHETL